ncbi:MAG: hypothetical protein Q8N88_04895, partial [Nanoarchaeota archaeon]|nr:hypothetical protein [Nanoarchaeota archaeon]
KIMYKKIPLDYIVGNTGLFNDLKNNYRKNKNFYLSFKQINFKNKIMLIAITAFYLFGYYIDKIFFPKGNEMTLFIVKND